MSRDPVAVVAYGGLSVLAGAALGTAAVFGALGGRPLSDGAASGLFLGLLILATLSLTFGVTDRHATPVLVVLWLVALVTIVALYLRGWRALQRRPHPFLANPP